MTVLEAIEQMTALEQKRGAYQHAMGMLLYDSETVAPSGSAAGRGETLGILAAEDYAIFANPQVGELLAFLKEHEAELPAQKAREAEMLRRDYEQTNKIPLEEYVAYTRLLNDASSVWRRAKRENDYASFAPFIDRIVAGRIQMAGYYQSGKAPYDVCLDENEKGMTRAELDPFFQRLREAIVPLVHRIQTEGRRIDVSFLRQTFPVDRQRELSDYLMQVLTIDRSHCNIGETEHPFTLGFNKDDVRITTHYYEDDVASSLYSVVHEGGHALYELHTDDSLRGTCLPGGVSMGIHESQSRLFENMIGRSRAFIDLIFPKLQELFPAELAGVTAEQFYLAVNRCEPSLIRTEADELTYCLHIMIRYEVEKRLFDGAVQAKDVPALWRELTREYLGIDVPSDTQGALQDSHWSNGQMGYFPSYAVGSAYAAQMMAAMRRDIDVEEAVRRGDLSPITGWLSERIWKYGRSKDPEELIQIACGEAFDPKYYIDYLTQKYSQIYGLS